MFRFYFIFLMSFSCFSQISYISGWNQFGIRIDNSSYNQSSPLVADLNADGVLDIISITNNGVVRAFTSNKVLLWSYNLPNYNCASKDLVYSSPAVGSLSGDGKLSVVVGYGGLKTKSCGGGVVALDATSGIQTWHFDAKKYAKLKKFYSISHAVFSTVALADTDGDGKLEIGFGGLDRNIYLLNYDGSVRWYYQAADTVFSSPIFANIDSTPELEMIIGTDIYGNKNLKPVVKSGGYLYALRTKPLKIRELYKFRNKDIVIWSINFEQVIQSTPAIAELVSTNSGEEIAVASGCFYPEKNSNKVGKWLKIISAKTGAILRTLELDNCTNSSPAIADINNDSLQDVVIMHSKNELLNIEGKVIAYNPENNIKLWSSSPFEGNKISKLLGYFSAPLIADLDNNASAEVIFRNGNYITILSGDSGLQLSNSNISAGGSITSPVIVDLNKDGKNDIVLLRNSSTYSSIMGYTNFSSILSTTQTGNKNKIYWGQYKRNNLRN